MVLLVLIVKLNKNMICLFDLVHQLESLFLQVPSKTRPNISLGWVIQYIA
jgi:hypothetical protein